ncbi:MAG: hypothetical protein EZS28_015978 [Streblomastix strix]|uniref:Uncharacterized protein n=1 Tax=Streblomastix strix TaxID=222440 RepID=A0A5J4W0M2_9EUKA|nr:MAG: hypothetical protein EZS28_015978 [Streblomastix strix]
MPQLKPQNFIYTKVREKYLVPIQRLVPAILFYFKPDLFNECIDGNDINEQVNEKAIVILMYVESNKPDILTKDHNYGEVVAAAVYNSLIMKGITVKDMMIDQIKRDMSDVQGFLKYIDAIEVFYTTSKNEYKLAYPNAIIKASPFCIDNGANFLKLCDIIQRVYLFNNDGMCKDQDKKCLEHLLRMERNYSEANTNLTIKIILNHTETYSRKWYPEIYVNIDEKKKKKNSRKQNKNDKKDQIDIQTQSVNEVDNNEWLFKVQRNINMIKALEQEEERRAQHDNRAMADLNNPIFDTVKNQLIEEIEKQSPLKSEKTKQNFNNSTRDEGKGALPLKLEMNVLAGTNGISKQTIRALVNRVFETKQEQFQKEGIAWCQKPIRLDKLKERHQQQRKDQKKSDDKKNKSKQKEKKDEEESDNIEQINKPKKRKRQQYEKESDSEDDDEYCPDDEEDSYVE